MIHGRIGWRDSARTHPGAALAPAAWFLFPQIADVDNTWDQIQDASIPWAIRTLGRDPARLLLLFGGSAVITLASLGAMAASLEAFGAVEDAAAVIPAVFLYRLVTFWMPILPGWLALAHLRRIGEI